MKITATQKKEATNTLVSGVGVTAGIGLSTLAVNSDIIPIENKMYKQVASILGGGAAAVLIKSNGKWYLDLAKAAGLGMVVGPFLQMIAENLLPRLSSNSKVSQLVKDAYQPCASASTTNVATTKASLGSRYVKGFRLGNAIPQGNAPATSVESMY
jgi:hypothetical protein